MNDLSLENVAQNLDLMNPPEGFVDDPFPFYDALLEHAPVLRQPDGSVCRQGEGRELGGHRGEGDDGRLAEGTEGEGDP